MCTRKDKKSIRGMVTNPHLLSKYGLHQSWEESSREKLGLKTCFFPLQMERCLRERYHQPSGFFLTVILFGYISSIWKLPLRHAIKLCSKILYNLTMDGWVGYSS